MAGRDYVLCAHCGVKVFYDGSQAIRDSLEIRWGDPNAPDFTVRMLCPDCLKKLEDEIERLRKLLRPFAALPVDALGQCQRHPDEPVFAINGVSFTATDVLRAREALGE